MFCIIIFYQIYVLDIFFQFIVHLSVQESIFCVVTFLILMKSNLLICFYYNLHHNKKFQFCSSIFFFQKKILFRITGQHFLTCIMLIHKTQFSPLNSLENLAARVECLELRCSAILSLIYQILFTQCLLCSRHKKYISMLPPSSDVQGSGKHKQITKQMNMSFYFINVLLLFFNFLIFNNFIGVQFFYSILLVSAIQ